MALTTMVGGATGGDWGIGSCVRATPPRTMMKNANTQAKKGRALKNLGMRECPLGLGRAQHGRCRCSGRGLPWHRLDRCAGRQHLQFLKTIDDDLLASLQAIE